MFIKVTETRHHRFRLCREQFVSEYHLDHGVVTEFGNKFQGKHNHQYSTCRPAFREKSIKQSKNTKLLH